MHMSTYVSILIGTFYHFILYTTTYNKDTKNVLGHNTFPTGGHKRLPEGQNHLITTITIK